jgi:hypothetical protein
VTQDKRKDDGHLASPFRCNLIVALVAAGGQQASRKLKGSFLDGHPVKSRLESITVSFRHEGLIYAGSLLIRH